jgi:hypothetical protein
MTKRKLVVGYTLVMEMQEKVGLRYSDCVVSDILELKLRKKTSKLYVLQPSSAHADKEPAAPMNTGQTRGTVGCTSVSEQITVSRLETSRVVSAGLSSMPFS